MATTVLGGRYQIRHKLGSGGMATVYEAHDELLDRDVAVKVLRSDGLSERNARQRFAAEARAAASLSHPHAVAVYDVSSGDDEPFIVMELVRGRTLQDVLDKEGALTEQQAVAVGSQVLAALHAAHRRGLVHRDVKPANILLVDGVVPSRPEELPGVKLADFGIAKAAADATRGLTMTGQVIGTPKYLSPEQVNGELATVRSDLYATAVVLYEMLAGRPPFDQDSAVALALAHRDEEPPPLTKVKPGVNARLAALVHQAMAKDPAERPPDANTMREALIATVSGDPSTMILDRDTETLPAGGAAAGAGAPPDAPTMPDTPTAPARPGRRVPRWLVVLAVVAVLAVALALWLSGRRGTPTDSGASEQPASQEQTEDTGAGEDGGGDAPAGSQDQQQQAPDEPQDQQQDQPADQQPAQPTETQPDEPGTGGGNDDTQPGTGGGNDDTQPDPGDEQPPATGEEPPPGTGDEQGGGGGQEGAQGGELDGEQASGGQDAHEGARAA